MEPTATLSQAAKQTQTPPPSEPSTTVIDPAFPATSLQDTGRGKRPRDARVIHMILANLGVTAYQERVPLQLMDFAYRYTSSVLQDALHLTSDAHANSAAPGKVAHSDANAITLQSLRLSIASRTYYQFSPSLPKEQLLEVAQERNKIALPPVGKDWGLRLPPERYCLTGVGYGLKEVWDSEGEEDIPLEPPAGDIEMDEAPDDEDEEGAGRMEDVFGEDADGAGDGEGDKEMG